MIPKDGITIRYIKAAAMRRFWYIVLPFFVIALGTLVHCIKAPRIYKSSTLILVQPQEVPEDYVRSTVSSTVTGRLHTLKEQVMSRPRLETIITKYDLYPELRQKATMFDAMEVMRKHITVEVNESRTRRDTSPASFEVSYAGVDRIKVRDVTASIANLFVIADLKLREKQAQGTSQFLERELERMRGKLRKKEDLVRRFKEENMGLLPEQTENNYRILEQSQQHLDSLSGTLQQTEDRKVLLQTQLNRLNSLQIGAPVGTVTQQGRPEDQDRLTLPQLRQQLKNLRSRYSNKHPDVIRLAATIAKREKQQDTFIQEDTSEVAATAPPTSDTERLMMAQKEDLLTQIELINKEIRTIQKDKQKTGKEIELYRLRIEDGPKIEQELVDLSRDYEEASKNYQSLLEKRLQAELAENLERTQKGEQFRILEPANLPEKPFKPDVLKILGLGFFLALGSGLGCAYLREYGDSTFWDRKNLERTLELPVLVSVPLVKTKQECRWKLLKAIGATGVILSMTCILVYALYTLWKMDPTVFPIPVG